MSTLSNEEFLAEIEEEVSHEDDFSFSYEDLTVRPAFFRKVWDDSDLFRRANASWDGYASDDVIPF
jgi:demethoxyubiquinone hydroxylase (CLK1/Coq7/Cat5 family)